MAEYKKFVLTNQGIELLADLMNGNGELEFRSLAVGSGVYAENNIKKIRAMETLKEERQRIEFSSIGKSEDGFVNLKANLTNENLEKGYSMTEAGIYAGKKGEQEEILYCVSTADNPDYMPDFSSRQIYNVIFRMLISIGDVSNATISYKTDIYALAEDLQIEKNRSETAESQLREDINTEVNRATDAEDELQRIKLDKDGDASDVVVKFREAEQLNPMSSSDKLSELLGISAKAVSSLIAHLADFNNPHKVSRKQLNVDNTDNTSDMDKPVSTAQQSALDALYQQMTTYTRQKISELVNGAPAALDTIKELADAISSHKSIMDALNEAIGKKANEAEFDSHVKDNGKHITDAERTKWNDAASKKHTHQNETILDGITSALIDKWNSAVTHISDAVKHITATERDKWNNGSHNYGVCSTAAATAAKAVACNGFKLATGAEITVKFTVTNTAANPTLNVNSTGAKAIYYRGSAIAAGYLAANRTYGFRYNGNQWDFVGDIDTNTNTTYSNFVKSGSGAKAGLVPAPPTTAGTAKYLREDGTWQVPPDTNTIYTHPSTAGNKHIPSGGAAGQILKWSADGTAVWGSDNNTTYNNFVKSGAGAKAGLVPSPPTTAGTTKYLREDGTWQVPPDTKTEITQSAAVTKAGQKALDAIEKNPSVEGTLAYDLSQLNSNIGETYHKFYENSDAGYWVPKGTYIFTLGYSVIPASEEISIMLYNFTDDISIGYADVARGIDVRARGTITRIVAIDTSKHIGFKCMGGTKEAAADIWCVKLTDALKIVS